MGGELLPKYLLQKTKREWAFCAEGEGRMGLVETSDSSCFQDVDGVY